MLDLTDLTKDDIQGYGIVFKRLDGKNARFHYSFNASYFVVVYYNYLIFALRDFCNACQAYVNGRLSGRMIIAMNKLLHDQKVGVKPWRGSLFCVLC